MTRSLLEIADSAHDDLRSIQDGFSGAHAIFMMILSHSHPDSTVHSLAQLGIIDIGDWSEKAENWADGIANELDALAQGAIQ